MQLLVGADPEVWVYKDGVPVSAYGMIEGDKKKPSPVRNGAVQVDGMALEFNINPAGNEDMFLYHIEDVLDQLKAMIPDYEVIATPVAEFGEDYINAQPEEATNLGCDPDFNAWTGIENPRPDGGKGFRTAAGHLHVGWTKDVDVTDDEHLGMVKSAVKQLDFFLGLPSVIYDSFTKRREMYGKAGAYRPKSYGLEYRTLSNLWLTDRRISRVLYRNVNEAFNMLERGEELTNKYGDIQHIINSSDKHSAIGIMKAEGISYVL